VLCHLFLDLLLFLKSGFTPSLFDSSTSSFVVGTLILTFPISQPVMKTLTMSLTSSSEKIDVAFLQEKQKAKLSNFVFFTFLSRLPQDVVVHLEPDYMVGIHLRRRQVSDGNSER